MALQLETAEQDGRTIIKVAGEVDLYTSPQLRTAIIKAIPKASCEVLGIDLSEVVYMDSSGVATLVEGLQKSQKQKTTFCLVAPSSAVMKVLQLARLDAVFDVRERL